MKSKKFIKLPFMPEALTIEDFVSNIERRIRKNIRLNSIIKAHDNLILPQDNFLNTKVMEHLLLRLNKKLPFNIVKRKGKKLSSDDLLDFDINFMDMVLFNKINKTNKYSPINVVHPQEIIILAKYFNIPGKVKSRHHIELLKLEKKYPSILFSIKKSASQLL
jgi:hypothetical protein